MSGGKDVKGMPSLSSSSSSSISTATAAMEKEDKVNDMQLEFNILRPGYQDAEIAGLRKILASEPPRILISDDMLELYRTIMPFIGLGVSAAESFMKKNEDGQKSLYEHFSRRSLVFGDVLNRFETWNELFDDVLVIDSRHAITKQRMFATFILRIDALVILWGIHAFSIPTILNAFFPSTHERLMESMTNQIMKYVIQWSVLQHADLLLEPRSSLKSLFDRFPFDNFSNDSQLGIFAGDEIARRLQNPNVIRLSRYMRLTPGHRFHTIFNGPTNGPTSEQKLQRFRSAMIDTIKKDDWQRAVLEYDANERKILEIPTMNDAEVQKAMEPLKESNLSVLMEQDSDIKSSMAILEFELVASIYTPASIKLLGDFEFIASLATVLVIPYDDILIMRTPRMDLLMQIAERMIPTNKDRFADIFDRVVHGVMDYAHRNLGYRAVVTQGLTGRTRKAALAAGFRTFKDQSDRIGVLGRSANPPQGRSGESPSMRAYDIMMRSDYYWLPRPLKRNQAPVTAPVADVRMIPQSLPQPGETATELVPIASTSAISPEARALPIEGFDTEEDTARRHSRQRQMNVDDKVDYRTWLQEHRAGRMKLQEEEDAEQKRKRPASTATATAVAPSPPKRIRYRDRYKPYAESQYPNEQKMFSEVQKQMKHQEIPIALIMKLSGTGKYSNFKPHTESKQIHHPINHFNLLVSQEGLGIVLFPEFAPIEEVKILTLFRYSDDAFDGYTTCVDKLYDLLEGRVNTKQTNNPTGLLNMATWDDDGDWCFTPGPYRVPVIAMNANNSGFYMAYSSEGDRGDGKIQLFEVILNGVNVEEPVGDIVFHATQVMSGPFVSLSKDRDTLAYSHLEGTVRDEESVGVLSAIDDSDQSLFADASRRFLIWNSNLVVIRHMGRIPNPDQIYMKTFEPRGTSRHTKIITLSRSRCPPTAYVMLENELLLAYGNRIIAIDLVERGIRTILTVESRTNQPPNANGNWEVEDDAIIKIIHVVNPETLILIFTIEGQYYCQEYRATERLTGAKRERKK